MSSPSNFLRPRQSVGSSLEGSFLSPVKYPILPLPRIYIRTDCDHRRKLSPFSRIVVIWTECEFESELGWVEDSDTFGWVTDDGVISEVASDMVFFGGKRLRVFFRKLETALIPYKHSGRAGRQGPGKCFRLYPESEFEKLEDSTKPEIKRCNLSNVILQLKALGVDDIIGFDFIEKPSRSAIVKSLEQLFLLGALTDECKLSDPVGHQMARLPLDPIYSKALILASESKCLEEMLITVAMLSVESIFYAPREKLDEARTAMKCFSSPEGDHLTLINVYRASNEFLEKRNLSLGKEKVDKGLRKWCKENFINSRSLRHARDIHSQIQGHVLQMGLHVSSCGDDMLQFRRCLAASFFLNAALKQPEGTYRALASGQVVQIHPSSVLFRAKPDCIIYNELVQTNHKYIRNVTRIDYLWLTELAPQFYTMHS
ncbi:Putative ATP-dependent RNA helicase DHX33 [Morus notabilis]|uniref:RNA helicase n=1 Tax=Morus notabilis TaxID=981085 RepID=W9QYV4_9ROSA|nr:Putative ATP-dependent RNA helicase DHX33 [Morus notabilis]